MESASASEGSDPALLAVPVVLDDDRTVPVLLDDDEHRAVAEAAEAAEQEASAATHAG